MTEIIRVETIEPLDPSPGVFPLQQVSVTYEVIALIDDMVQVLPARIYPPELAEPAEFGPAECIGTFTLEPGELRPPTNAPNAELFQYLEEHVHNWHPTGF